MNSGKDHPSFQRKSMNSGVKPHEKLRIQVIPCPENFRLLSKSGEFAEHEFPTFSSILFDFQQLVDCLFQEAHSGTSLVK